MVFNPILGFDTYYISPLSTKRLIKSPGSVWRSRVRVGPGFGGIRRTWDQAAKREEGVKLGPCFGLKPISKDFSKRCSTETLENPYVRTYCQKRVALFVFVPRHRARGFSILGEAFFRRGKGSLDSVGGVFFRRGIHDGRTCACAGMVCNTAVVSASAPGTEK